MNNEKVTKALNEVFVTFKKSEVAAVYLTGSMLNTLNGSTSDVDLYVVLRQSKLNLVNSSLKSGQHTGENDYKYMETYKFASSLLKTNPTTLEMVYNEPLYVSDEFKPMADFLFENKDKIVTLNLKRYYSSSYHMLANNMRSLTKDPSNPKFNKFVMNFYKGYMQATATNRGDELSNYVKFTGKKQAKLLSLKHMKHLNESELEDLVKEMNEMLDELKELKEKYTNVKVNQELLDQMLTYL